ncbi:MAG: hypothetical protein JNM27_13665 [Leptospirales bacterium]|nr:hypothetical protein [Leptospirales bacterium]
MSEIKNKRNAPVPKPYEWLTEEHRRSLVRFFQLLEIGERRAENQKQALAKENEVKVAPADRLESR